MPALDLIVREIPFGTPPGELHLNPPLPGLNRVLLRRLYCGLRVSPVPGVYDAVLDTGAPLTLFPRKFWDQYFRWRAGRDYDELSIAGFGTTLQGQVLGHSFTFKLARLRVPVELVGRDIRGTRLRIDSLVCQLADTGGPPYILLGLWGGAFIGRKLAVEPQPNSDDLVARLEF